MKYSYFLKKQFPDPPEEKWTESDSYRLFFDGDVVRSDKSYVLCLEKDPEKDFTILNLTDIQLRLPELRQDADCVAIAEKTIKKLVKKVKPDLITVTGDQGFGDKTEILAVGRMIDRFGIPWAPVFGNADNRSDEGISTGKQTFLYENAFNNCLLKAGPTDLAALTNGAVRYGNYIVNIVERDDTERGFHVVRSLLFFNSGDEEPYDEKDYPGELRANPDEYSRLTERQISWYKWAVKEVRKYGLGNVPSSIFLHIPIYAYNQAYAAAKGENGWNKGYEDSFGEARETSGTPPYDDGVLQAIKEENSTDFIICGHDHRNDYIITHEGVTYCYGLKTGKGCYWDKDMSGGTVVTVKKDGTTSARHEFCPVRVIGIPRWVYPIVALAGLAVGLLAGLL